MLGLLSLLVVGAAAKGELMLLETLKWSGEIPDYIYPNEYKYKVLTMHRLISQSDLPAVISEYNLGSHAFCPGIIEFALTRPLNHPVLEYLEFVPEDGSGLMSYDEMGDCLPGSYNCEAYVVGTFKLVDFYVGPGWFHKKEEPLKKQVTNSIQGTCILFATGDAGVSKCSNGEYASNYVRLNSVGQVTNYVHCLPCDPGTWLTCICTKPCTWDIPLQDDTVFQKPSTMYDAMEGVAPVGACFSCETAGQGKGHYMEDKTGLAQSINPPPSDPLRWYCPGNIDADGVPRMCPEGDMSVSNPEHTQCVCAPGKYNFGNVCRNCLVGYMCPTGELIACPDHSYQDQAGQTDCTPCTLGDSKTPRYPCPWGQLMRQCRGRFTSQVPVCVPCSMCNKAYVNVNMQGKVDCYES